jgi:hypothetical protein
MNFRWIALLVLAVLFAGCSNKRTIGELADAGDKIVAAIDSYKASHGAFPESLSDLKSMSEVAIPAVDSWTYVTMNDGTYVLYAYVQGHGRTTLWFFPSAEDEGAAGWWLDEEDGSPRSFVRGKK